jgi:TolB protein
MDRNTTRLSRAVLVGAVGFTLLFAAAGCAALCHMDRRHAAENPAAAEGHEVARADAAAADGQAPADDAAAAPAQSGDAAAGSAGVPPHEPRWANEPQAAHAAQTVNVFGELDGVQRGVARPVGESGFQQHTSVDEGEDGDVAVDPTGRWLAFSSTRHNEAGDIYLQRVDGTAVTQLTNDAERDAYPAFSPDGKWIAFSSTRAGNWQVYRMDLDGRNVVQVTSGPMQAIHPSFSPDGTRLAYSALGARSRQWELWTVDLATSERRQIGYGLFPSWSPDKSVDRIAYQRARQRGSRWFSLWTLDLVRGEGRRMTEVAVSSNAAIVAPCWSPDGKRLAFTTVVQNPAGGGEAAGGQQDVWTVDADGANRVRLTDGNGTNLTPAWSVDDRVYFVSDRGGNESVWSVNAGRVDSITAQAGPKAGEPPTHGAAADNTQTVDPFGPAAGTNEIGQ